MSMPVSFMYRSYADNTVKPNGEPESASVELPIATLTPANVAAKSALVGALAADLIGITLAAPLKAAIIYDRSQLGVTPAASTLSQRENKWLIRYHDAVTNKKYRASIPCADLTKLVSGEEFLDITTGAGATLKTDFEAIVVSPDDSANAVVMDSVQFVGRKA